MGSYSYTWDANRNKLSESITGILSGMGFTPVTYDNEERLTAWSRSDGNQGQTWSLSLVGDWNTHAQTGTVAFTQNRVHGPAHEFNSFTGTSSGTLTYDVKGNTTSRPATLAAPALNLTWDFGNQLSGVDTNGTPASLEVTYRYDVLGRRVGRVEGGSSIVFVQASQQTIADYDAGQVPSKPNHIYVYGSYIDEPIARRESQSLAYFHRNQQYSIVAISNSSSAVIERYSYTAHGQPTVYDAAGTIIPAPTFGNRFTYTGREWDATLALHYFRARWYDPLAGRFISRDPLGYVDGMSIYRLYMGLALLDPDGEKVFSAAGIIVIAAILTVFACAYPQYEYALDTFKPPIYTDKFLHCWVSCRVAKSCGPLISQAAGIAQETRDSAVRLYCENVNPNHPICGNMTPWIDSLLDLNANIECMWYWEQIILGTPGGWLSYCFREPCEECCARKVLRFIPMRMRPPGLKPVPLQV